MKKNNFDDDWEMLERMGHAFGLRETKPRLNSFGSPITVQSVGSNMDIRIPNLNPHYTDERFRHGQLIWGRDDAKDIHWNYSDRLSQWDYQKNQNSWNAAKELYEPGTARFYQEYLSNYEGKPVELIGIVSGWNWFNGYSYLVYGYRVIEEKK